MPTWRGARPAPARRRHGGGTEIAAGPRNPYRDLAAVGDQDLVQATKIVAYLRTVAVTSTVTERSPFGLTAREMRSGFPDSSSGCTRTCTNGTSLPLWNSTPMRVST